MSAANIIELFSPAWASPATLISKVGSPVSVLIT